MRTSDEWDTPADVGETTCRPRGQPKRRRQRARPEREVLPADVRALVTRGFVTPAHVDVLLALRRSAPASCRLEDLAAAASLPRESVARRCLADLVDAGLAAGAPDAAYRYAPASGALRESVTSLADEYRERRLLVLRAIYGTTTVVRVGERHPGTATRRANGPEAG